MLSEAGYVYDGAREREGHAEGEEGASSDLFHQDRVRVVITGADGLVVRDNLSELSPGSADPGLEGRREAVLDLAADLPVGHVYVDVNHEYLSTESHGFLNTLLYITLIGGTLTVGVAILLAFWLSRRITAPVAALTDATQAIAQGDTAKLPVTSSDELGRMSAAFNRMTSALETQRELRRRLINDVSHELNTPLSVILLEAKGLRDGLQLPESASDHIIQEVDRLRGLVTDLDWLTETDYGELRLTLEATSVPDLLSSEAERWQPQSQAQEIELSLQVSNDLPDMELDRMRMSQALGNVISKRHSLHRRRWEHRAQGGTGRRRGFGHFGHRRRNRHSRRRPSPRLRALLPHRPLPQPRDRWHRPGTGHHQGHSGGAWRHDCSGK